jgi:aldehyde:ferredoxin oxidoreductase
LEKKAISLFKEAFMAYMGLILRIDLSKGSITKENFPEDLAKLYLGGRGLATKMLVDEVDPKVDPLSPENKLFFATGPLTNTTAPTGGRYMVITKSPLTNLVASSNSGGYFGARMKKAGYDILVFEGKSEKPVYLYIDEETAELRDASHLWGKKVWETTDLLLEETGQKNASVSCIGPAGETLSLMASIMNDKNRAAGRSGVGAVMGSKNLKAIVAYGKKHSPIVNEVAMRETVKQKIAMIKAHGVTGQGLPALGTKVLDNIINESGLYPTRNFQEAQFSGVAAMSGEALVDKYLVKNSFCYACPIGCGRVVELPNGMKGEGPEYESGWAFGPACGIDDLNAITEANFICNDLGFDTISAGVTISAAMELYEKGYIPDADLGKGPKLKFGTTEALAWYLKVMASRTGIGDLMTQGSYRLADAYGHPELSMSVKKQELPAYDPRGVQGHGLGYATSNRGGCHVRQYLISPEILGVPEKLDPQAIEGKPQWVITFQDLSAVIDSSGLCLFTSFALGAPDYADLLNAALGQNWSAGDILKIGERIWNLERKFNLDAGMDPADDTLPKRLLETPIERGPNKGHVHRLSEMLPIYYEIRGWDKRGIPGDAKLKELSML